MDHVSSDRFKTAVLLVELTGLVSGLALRFLGRTEAATIAWTVGVILVLAALLTEILRSLWRGEVGLDIVAALSMSAALTFSETLAAAVIAAMYSGGTFLESFAEGRARREMHALLSRVPRTATRHRNGELQRALEQSGTSMGLPVPSARLRPPRRHLQLLFAIETPQLLLVHHDSLPVQCAALHGRGG